MSKAIGFTIDEEKPPQNGNNSILERKQMDTEKEKATNRKRNGVEFYTRLMLIRFLYELTIKQSKRRKNRSDKRSDNDGESKRQSHRQQRLDDFYSLWRIFLQTFTLHGFRFVFEKGAWLRRLTWVAILIIAITALVIQSQRSIRKFFRRPITTIMNAEYQGEITFPAVTLCNFNLFPFYLINGTVGEEVVSILAANDSTMRAHQDTLFSAGSYTTNIRDYRSVLGNRKVSERGKKYHSKSEILRSKELEKRRKQGHPLDKDFDFRDFVKKHGHKISHMIQKCRWKAQKCGPANFTTVLTEFGLCYTFNSGKDNHPLLKVHRAGVDYGLKLELNVQQDQYYGGFRDSSGFKVMLHDQNEPPLINELGFAIHPGMHTFCGVKKTKVINLPLPWETACEDSSLAGYASYSKAACILNCRAEYIVKKCKCRSFQHDGKTPLCLPQQMRDCVKPAMATFMNETDHCACPVPCEMTKYQAQLSYAQMPARHFSEALAKLKHIDKDRMRHFLRDNILELDVYFEEMNTQVIQQVPAYDEESLFGDIGGQVGLFLGASILTVLEVCDLIGRVIIINFRRKREEHIV